MIANPMLGVFFHWLGGLAAGSFYVPYRGVKEWAWEVYWLVGGVFSWILAPWVLALINTEDLFAVLAKAPAGSIMWAYFWGVMWGVGGLTFGLTMRYLGVSLGVAVALGYCAAFGTLMPPVFHGEFVGKILGTSSGLVILSGIGVCLAGIAIAGLAGRSKEREMTPEQKSATIKEFHFTKGVLLATFSGLMSACFAFGLDAAAPIADISALHGTTPLWTGLPKLCVVLLGGFTTNFIWCVALNIRNRTGRQYFTSTLPASGQDPLPAEVQPTPEAAKRRTVRIPMLRNYLFSALAGSIWYLQFFFYSMGETQMGDFKFSSWTLHMASIIIFSSLWGVALKEWKGSSGKTKTTLFFGLAVLVVSTVIVGYGNFLGAAGRQPPPPEEGSARAEWVAPSAVDVQQNNRPCPLVRSMFTLDEEPAAGTIRITGLGHYELSCNGAVVGTSLVNQPWSQYNKTIYWQEFDIGAVLRRGANVFGVQLGNSFWRVGPANDTMRYVKTDAMPDFSGGHPYLLRVEAHVTLKDGRERVITTDSTWKWQDGPLTFSHIYAGEDFDARLVPSGWDTPGFDDRSWKPARVVAGPTAALEAYTAPPIKAFEVFSPTGIVSPRAGEYTYVFPQNCSALLRFTVEGAAGQTVRLKPCEYMDSTGHVKFTYTWGTGKDIWHDYTVRGSGAESHQILFCYVGCQYVGVTGAVPEGHANPGGLPRITSLELVHVRAACPEAGSFSCSSGMQNSAHRMIDWAIRSNMSYVATDCPHREKNGWQEENWHMARAVSYRFDTRSWLRKISRDLRDTQLPDGHIPTNCPNYLVGIPPHGYWNEAPEWGISGVLLPWHVYEWYGDRSALLESYESMKEYVDYLSSQAREGIITSNLGDWYDYGHGKGDGPSQWTPNEVSATAIWALGVKTVAQTAEVLGRTDDRKHYRGQFEQIRRDFQRHFYDAKKKTVRNNGSCQAANSVALWVGLVPRKDRPAVLKAIVDDLRRRKYQQTVGEVLQVFLIRVLAEENRNDVLHRVYAREERGGYGYMVRQGFTTLPESWDARPGTPNSMNHFMLGHLMEWHYAYVAGIRQQPGSAGWRRVLIAPNPGPFTSASASFRSPAGLIAVEWTRSKGKFVLQTTVPEGVEAEALLPDGRRQKLSPGVRVLQTKL